MKGSAVDCTITKETDDDLAFLRSLALRPAPVASGIGAPTIPFVPMNPHSGAYMCILPPRPPELPVVLPQSSAKTTLAGTPLASA